MPGMGAPRQGPPALRSARCRLVSLVGEPRAATAETGVVAEAVPGGDVFRVAVERAPEPAEGAFADEGLRQRRGRCRVGEGGGEAFHVAVAGV